MVDLMLCRAPPRLLPPGRRMPDMEDPMDSLYQALKSADAANSTAEADPSSSSALDHGGADESTDTKMSSDPSTTNTERVLKRVASHPTLSTIASSSLVAPGSGPSIARAQTTSPLHSEETSTPSQFSSKAPSEIETGHPTLQRTESLLSSSSSSHEAGLLPPRTSSRLGASQISRSTSPAHQGDVSDTPSLSSSLQTSRSLSSPSTPSGGHAQSPITPESPMLHTPLDTFGSVLGGLTSSTSQNVGTQPSVVTLGPIMESDMYENQFDDSRSTTPSQITNIVEVQVHPPPGKMQRLQDVEEEPPQIKRERSASWNDLKAAFSQSKRRLSPNNATPESLSPTTPNFPSQVGIPSDVSNGGSTEETPTRSFFGRNRAESQPTKVGSGSGIFLARSIFSKASKAERDDAKSRAKVGAGQERAASPSTPTSPSLPWTPSMESGDSQLSSKAAKAMEKNRRKEEQKRKLEQLAEQLKAGNKKGQDGLSFTSSSSGEQRKAANHWIEETDGMYGGSINSWGGL
ncbi:hypothetical protein SCHPADRAFT_199163 [Schizopora paradoxa]|uniref:Uncharacterized protein n=1 Tax=Schizopora paradoxa TaxID=27342 RepID=A0A0H2SI38_9AGAM|nr:hypothetical protein SCHPADRAFT_199163 [Schizopora paradoxa]